VSEAGAPKLEKVLAALEAIAPLSFAESWDNVGLLIPASHPARDVERVFLTIDLTEPVLEEALAARADLVVAYHPVIFEGKKRFLSERANDRVVVAAIRAGLPVYCPHTSLDVAPSGIADWLASGIGDGTVRAIEPRRPSRPEEEGTVAGLGRLLELALPRELDAIVHSLKSHLGVETLRVAKSEARRSAIRTVAVCAGAGGAVFERAGAVDLLVTGEMRHHDVLARVAAGTHVILAEHTNSERGFLAGYAMRLEALVPGVRTILSTRDKDPLEVA
jgi:dinuclear metal center YbgI/SA1388 family protein